MSIIVRPNKPVGGGGTGEWTAGSDLYANELNDDINTLYSDYNGNITNDNISATAAINGSKLADAPNGIPTAKYNALSVTNDKIANTTIQKGKLAYLLAKDALAISINEINTGAVVLDFPNATQFNPSVAFATADYDLIGLMVYSIVTNGGAVLSADINGANWAAALSSVVPPNCSWQGIIRWIFLKKVSA